MYNKSDMSKKDGKTLLLSLLLSLFAFICIATFFACSSKSITINVEGEAYRGATLTVNALTMGLDNPEKVLFSIKEEYGWAFFSDGKLVLTQKAQPNATLTIVAEAEGIVQEYVIVVKNTPVTEIEPIFPEVVEAGAEYELSATLSPVYATDVIPVFSIVSGENIASIDDDILTVFSNANKTDELVIRVTAGGIYEDRNIAISTIQPESLEIIASSTQLKRGEVASIYCKVTPSDCTLGNAELVIEKSEYYTYANGQITIAKNAPEGNITVKASLGGITSSLDISIIKTPVEKIDFYSDTPSSLIHYGDRIKLFADVFPENATYSEVTLTVIEGEEYVELDRNNYTLTVISKEIDKEIIVKADADGISCTLSFFLSVVNVEGISLECNGSTSVKVGDIRELKVTIIPEYATVKNYEISIVDGNEYVEISNGNIMFTSIGDGITNVTVCVEIGGIFDTIIFSIVPIPVEAITIASDFDGELESGDVVNLTGIVTPSSASYPELTYYIEEGDTLATIDGNRLIVNDDSVGGTVYVYAKSADGVKSNSLCFYVIGDVVSKKPTSWSELDNNSSLFDGIQRLRLNLSELPNNADCTTIIISDDVEYLELWGAYNGIDGEYLDLSLYFLTTDSIEVVFNSFGVVQSDGYTGYVVDFGTKAKVELQINGNNLIEAGDAYCINTEGYMVDGYVGYQTNTSGIEEELSTNYITKNGMDGFGGRRGGIAINAYSLEIVGNGFLTVKAGDGSNGTDGTNGADHSSVGGNGGNGGYGGDSGLALLCYELIVDTGNVIKFIGGNAGVGGNGGNGGYGGDSGEKGQNGSNGIVYAPIYAYNSLVDVSKTAYTELGKISSNDRIMEYASVKSFANSLEKYYKIKIHYGSSLDNPYSTTYSMTSQSDGTVLMKMLYGLEYTLAVFPKNLYLELADIKDKAIDIYLADSITKRTSGSFIYGLTSTKNNVWFATFNTKLRETFYSTYVNIFIHEFFHLLTFGMGSTSSNPLKTSLPNYNIGYSYRTTQEGVYNPEMGRSASDSPFLTAYSKSDFNEDISDNMSLVCIQVVKRDFLSSTAPIAKKVLHISEVYEGIYYNLTNYTPVVWKRFL